MTEPGLQQHNLYFKLMEAAMPC